MRVKKNKKISFYSKIAGIAILLCSFYVWQRNESTMLGYKISKIENEFNALSEENKYLAMKIMNIAALNRLEEIARKKLGLITPRPSDIVIIEEDKK